MGTFISDWEYPQPEVCVCGNLTREHWRKRNCLMTERIKYPKTMHFPWSPNLQNDDRLIQDNQMPGKVVVMTEKMDGENTTMYYDGIHARSRDSLSHPSRTFVQALHGQIAHLIPVGFRICGENLFAKHSIHYRNLKSYFHVFSIWDKDNNCFSWDDTKIFCDLLGLKPVPEIWWGVYDEQAIHNAYHYYSPGHEVEGYVVRVTNIFSADKFENCVAKYVRKGHVQTSEHWMNEAMVKNELEQEFTFPNHPILPLKNAEFE